MLAELVAGVRESRGLQHKRDIEAVMQSLAPVLAIAPERSGVPVGDDCAAIPDGDGYLLFAIEGLINEFVEREPWFAGYCGVMVNISDVYAMGGRPIAVVDAVWSRDSEHGKPILEGMASASRTYNVPIVGGHTNSRSLREQLSVAVLGRAQRLLTSFDARSGDVLLAAIDLRGRYREPYPYWDASTTAPAARLRADLEVLPALAEAGLCRAGKDISMAGVIGTALMLLECSGLGASIDVASVPAPQGEPLLRWLLSTFPSFGFLLTAAPKDVSKVIGRFAARDIACAAIGSCDDTSVVRLREGKREEAVWDFAAAGLIGCGPKLKALP